MSMKEEEGETNGVTARNRGSPLKYKGYIEIQENENLLGSGGNMTTIFRGTNK